MKTTLLYTYQRDLQADTLTKVYVAQSRVGISSSVSLREIDLLVELLQLYQEHRPQRLKRLWTRVCDLSKQLTCKLYRATGFAEWDRLILEQFLFCKHKRLTAKYNLSESWFGWSVATSVLTIALSYLQQSPATVETLLEIAKAATPHMGVTTFQQLNRTAKVSSQFRDV